MSEGLEGVVAASTRLSQVDGEAGRLIIAGYAVDDLAPAATFEQVAYLLLNGRLPEPDESTTFARDLAARRELPHAAIALLREAADANTKTMDALRMATPVLSLGSREDPVEDAMTAIAAFPTIVGSYWRIRRGESPVPVRSALGHAAHFLHQLSGSEPTPERARALETYLNTVCDHGLNASTFAARVIVSEAVIRAMLDRGERIMGFGHRVYRVRDPRADVLAAAAERFYSSDGDRSIYELARHVEATALRLLREKKPDRRLDTNVEFYTALLLHGIGLPTELFTPTFAVGRVLGWSAHCLEQLRDGRLIRPQSLYIGPTDLHYDRDRYGAPV